MPVEESLLALSEVSLWVLDQMQAVSQFLGMFFEGVERQAIEFFIALEKEISSSTEKIRYKNQFILMY